MLALNEYRRQFGSDDSVFLVYRAKDGDVFSRESLLAIQQLTDDLRYWQQLRPEDYPDAINGIDLDFNELNHVRRVQSIANLRFQENQGDTLLSNRLVPEQLPESDDELAAIKTRALNQQDYLLAFYSADARYGAVMIQTDFGAQPVEGYEPAVNATDIVLDDSFIDFDAFAADDNFDLDFDESAQIQEVSFEPVDMLGYTNFHLMTKALYEKYDEQFEFFPVGNPPMMEFMMDTLSQMQVLGLVMILIFTLLLYILFRSFSAVLWPMVTIAASMAWTWGFTVWLGVTISQMISLTVLLVFAVLLLGLGNWRLALITAVAIPVALVGSFTLLKLSGGTLNAFTLFGLVLATGVVVDDAIVVSEDIGRRISGGAKPFRAAREAMDELSGAVIATSLVLIVVFLPVLVMPGSLGRLYQPLAVVISSTILFSTINALSFTPVASAVLLGKSFRPAPKQVERLRRGLARSSQWLDALQQPYQRLLERALRRRRLVLSLLGAGLLITAIGLRALPTGFVPQEDGGQIRGVVVLPEGASLERTQSAMQRVQQAVATEPLVRYGNFYAGRSFGDSAPNKGIFFLRLKPLQQRSTSTSEVVERLNPALQRAMAGDGRVILSQPQPVRGFGSEGGISLNLLDVSGGRLSLQQFGDEADDFIAAAKASGRFERVGTRFSANAPSLEVIPDRQQLAAVGVSLEEVVAVIGDSFGSTYVNDTFSDARVRRVIVQLQGSDRSSPGDVLRLLVRNRDGRLIPLSNLVRLEPTTGPTSINHSELSRAISIRAKPKRGISSGQAMATLERVQQQRNTPTTELQFTGLSLEEQRAGGGTWKLFGLGLLVVYLLLAALYESAIDPVIILITVPLALLGVVLGLAARGLFLDVYGQVGILVLISLAAKNGILIVEFANQRVKRGIAVSAAIREAASLRLRPILLTGVSSLAGFLPLVLASGAGAARSISIGTVAFSGLLASTALSLLVLPVVYEIVKTWEQKRTQKLG